MIVLIYMLCGFFGGIFGFLCAGVWTGAALVFGFAAPTADVVQGLLLLFGSLGVVGSVILSGIVVVLDL